MIRSIPKSRRRHARRGDGGFTLVEMLVVITIIALIVGLVGPRVLNYLSESKIKAARIQIESLGSALDLYYLDIGRYPNGREISSCGTGPTSGAAPCPTIPGDDLTSTVRPDSRRPTT
jgi:general secretion pathway protein G